MTRAADTAIDPGQPPAPPPAELQTSRLVLRAAAPGLAAAAAAYFRRNREAHAPWNPPSVPALFDDAAQAALLGEAAAAMAHGAQASWWLFERNPPPGTPSATPALGRVQLTQIARGPFCSAMLGYSIDATFEGRGLMREALQAVLSDAFGRLGLHRVQANVRPDNTRSLGLLARLGFEHEGLAREYLFIDGAWRDHVMTALRHPHWRADQPPPGPAGVPGGRPA